MKKCNFCGALNDNNAQKCKECSAKEFVYICNNCGTEFNEGNYCPKCGVKITDVEKTCPECGKKYYSRACPDCGYVSDNDYDENEIVYIPTNASSSADIKKKRKTWLWVLGWICIFPLPLTILLLRKKDMKPVFKYGIIIVAWIVYIIIGIAGNAGDTNDASNEKKDSSTSVTTEVEEKIYADDVVVNRFITEFNDKYDDFTDISKGNIRTKYYGHIRNTRVELLNANDAVSERFFITIYGGGEESEIDDMFAAFVDIIPILEPTITEEEVNKAVEDLKTIPSSRIDYKLGKATTATYYPSVDSWSAAFCRIEISTPNYKETSEKDVPTSTDVELNSLQLLFANLTSETTKEDIDAYISENGLLKYAFTGDSGYYIGYEESAISKRDRDREGEAVDISFVTSGDANRVGTVSSAEYAIHTGFDTHYLLMFKDGAFYYDGKKCTSGEEAIQKFIENNR